MAFLLGQSSRTRPSSLGNPMTAVETSHGDIVNALIAFHQALEPITKSTKAQYGKYADLATINKAVMPLLLEHGLVITQEFDDDAQGSQLVTTLHHISGGRIVSCVNIVPSPGGKGNALHSWGAAVTYQRRYAILSLLNLAPEEDDGDSFGKVGKSSATSSNDDFL